MEVHRLIERHRNDYSFIAKCPNCGFEHKRGDGYADAFFVTQVVPNQHCPECDLNSFGETPEQAEARWARSRAAPTQPNHEGEGA